MTLRDVLKSGMDERTTDWKDNPEENSRRPRRCGVYSLPAPIKGKASAQDSQSSSVSGHLGSTILSRKEGKRPKRLSELERTVLAAIMSNCHTVIRPHASEKRRFKKENPRIRFISNRIAAMYLFLGKSGEAFVEFEKRIPNRVRITPMGRDFLANFTLGDGSERVFNSQGISSVIIGKHGEVRVSSNGDRTKQDETWVPTYTYAAWKVDGEHRGIDLAEYSSMKTFKLRQERTGEGARRLTRVLPDGSHDVLTFPKHVAFYLDTKGEIRYIQEQPYLDAHIAEACRQLIERGLVVKKGRSPVTLTNLKLTSAGEAVYLENPRRKNVPKRHPASTIPEARLSPLDWQLLWRAVGEDHTPLLSPENHIGQPASKVKSPATKTEIETALINLKTRDLIVTPQLRSLKLTAKGRLLLNRPTDKDRTIIDKREKQLHTVLTAVGFAPELAPMDPHSKEALEQLKGSASLKRIREYTHSGVPVNLWVPKSKEQGNAPAYKRRELGHDLILAEGLRQIMLKLEAEGAEVVGFRSERDLRSEQTRINQGTLSPNSPDHYNVGLPDGVITYRTAFAEEKSLGIEADAGHSPLSNSRGYLREAIAAKAGWAKSRNMQLVFVVDHPARAANLRRDGRTVHLLVR
ncbi:hypothetical protein SCOR_10085 [Sulfidibacter corallicola]|uniref:Uncharacterized protein n=1 Tax=Sulfidibacter corallicola TaxID=2818388 RepID=A0A8A4TNZ3_SULCO|nr:hypothetical protein [Sulfidibacter corallicola]QTD48305.1 hypothetical protein J3U87_22225 [Sulfidibacter corallicola]